MIVAWNMVLLVQHDGNLLCLKEKPLATKLELLFSKSLYLVALSLAHSEQVWTHAIGAVPSLHAGSL